MKTTYFLGSDIGTGSCKTVVVDEAGQVVASASRSYPCAYPQPDWVEQNPEDWYRAFCETVQEILTTTQISPAAIRSVAIVGITHNPVLLDRDDQLVRPSIHFWDQRSRVQVAALKKRWGDQIVARALNDVDVLWTWPQLMWVRDFEPAVWQRIALMLFPKDYVRHRLAPSLLTDTVDPAGTLLFNPRSGRWIDEFVDDLGLPAAALPPIKEPLAIAGYVSAVGAQESGLAAGTPVITGTTDTAAETLGSGGVEAGVGIVKLASVGRLMVVAEKPLPGGRSLNYPHVFKGLWYPGSVTKYGASAYNWIRQLCWVELDEKTAYQTLDAAAGEIAAGSDGIFFHPHLLGEYAPQWDPNLRGSFTGLAIQHGRAHLTRAVLEGVAFQIRSAFDVLEEQGAGFHEICLIGGGANSTIWSEIMTNVLGRPLTVPRYRSAAYGAALLAGIGADGFPNDPAALKALRPIEAAFDPDVAKTAFYADRLAKYKEIDKHMQAISTII